MGGPDDLHVSNQPGVLDPNSALHHMNVGALPPPVPLECNCPKCRCLSLIDQVRHQRCNCEGCQAWKVRVMPVKPYYPEHHRANGQAGNCDCVVIPDDEPFQQLELLWYDDRVPWTAVRN